MIGVTKKSLETRMKLLESGLKLIESGDDKITVTKLTAKAKVAYGSFYAHFANLGAFNYSILELAVENVTQNGLLASRKISSHILKVYASYLIAFISVDNKNLAKFVINHNQLLTELWFNSETFVEKWLNDAVTLNESTYFSNKNIKHYKETRDYFFWIFPKIMDDFINDKDLAESFLRFMQTVNFLDLPYDLHMEYANRAIKAVQKDSNLKHLWNKL